MRDLIEATPCVGSQDLRFLPKRAQKWPATRRAAHPILPLARAERSRSGMPRIRPDTVILPVREGSFNPQTSDWPWIHDESDLGGTVHHSRSGRQTARGREDRKASPCQSRRCTALTASSRGLQATPDLDTPDREDIFLDEPGGARYNSSHSRSVILPIGNSAWRDSRSGKGSS